MANVNLTDRSTIDVVYSSSGTSSVNLSAADVTNGLSKHIISAYASYGRTAAQGRGNVYVDIGGKRLVDLTLGGYPHPGANLISKDNMVSLTDDGPTTFSCGGDAFVYKTVTYITLHENGVGTTPTTYLNGSSRNLRSSYIQCRSISSQSSILVDNPSTNNARCVVQSVLITSSEESSTRWVRLFQNNGSTSRDLITRMPIEPGITLVPIGRNAPVCLFNGYDLRITVYNNGGAAISGTDVSAYATYLVIG